MILKRRKLEAQPRAPCASSFLSSSAVGQTFTPMPIPSVWTDAIKTKDCLSIIIFLRSGVRPKDVLFLRVLEGGRELKLSIICPQQFYDMSMLQKNGSHMRRQTPPLSVSKIQNSSVLACS